MGIERTRLGMTSLEISRVGFGAWALGGAGWSGGWGKQDEKDSVAAIQSALEMGVNWIDTAPVYGFGRSEEIVGRALQGVADRPYLFTKCSLLEGPDGVEVSNLKRDSILREVEASLRRLRVAAIDLYQIHWPIPEEDIEEGWATVVELQEQGMVRHIGVSNFDVAQIQRLQAIAPVETLQPCYSLIDRVVEAEVLPFARREGIGVIVYSPMGSGLLTGKITPARMARLPDDDWRKHDEQFREPQLARHLAAAERLRTVGVRHDRPPGAMAIAWALRNPAVDAAIVGFRSPGQVEEILAAGIAELTPDDARSVEAPALGDVDS